MSDYRSEAADAIAENMPLFDSYELARAFVWPIICAVHDAAAAAAREEGWEQGREAEMEQCVEFVRNGWKNLECEFDTSRSAPPSLGYWFGKLSDALELSREAAAVARSRSAAGEQGRGGGE